MSSPSCAARRARQFRCSAPSYLRTLTTSSVWLLCLSSTLGPICQKLSLPFFGQRMTEKLIDDFEWHSCDISTHSRCFYYVNWVSQTGCKDFGLPGVVLIDFHNLLE